ncbi:MAG: hypothetical protein J2P36_26560, partial [Ktedonobacteraceae bacterium]|nr:hypothetical protein [Ktedonobacteraceae bacterium]
LLEKVSSDDESRPAVIRALARLTPDILSQMLLDPNFTQPFHQTLLSLVPLGREAGPLFPALFDLYKSYWADPVILIVLPCVGYHAAEALPFMRKHYEERREDYEEQREYHKKNIQYDRNRMKETGESKDISLQDENYYFLRETSGGVMHMLHALRGILIDIFLEGERQRGVHPQVELQQMIERIDRVGPSRRQRHLLASLNGRILEEHDVLRIRVALGDLPDERLELAAYLGYQPAMRALHQKLPRQQDIFSTQAFSTWADGLAKYGVEVCARIGHALVRSVLPFWDGEYWDDLPPRHAVIALEDWVYAPERVPREYVESKGAFSPNQWCSPSSFAAAQAIKYATRLVRSPDGIGDVLFSAVRAWMSVGGVIPIFGSIRPDVPMHRKRAIAHLRETIREMLIPWVLQRCDPVRDALIPLAALMPHDILLLEPLERNDG